MKSDEVKKVEELVIEYGLKPAPRRDLSLFCQTILRRGYTEGLKSMTGFAYDAFGAIWLDGDYHSLVNNKEKPNEVIFNEGEILVVVHTNPDYIQSIRKCSAIVTDESGVLSHAAVIARELKKPCIIGAKIATKVLKDGMTVEVDADNGVVKIIKRKIQLNKKAPVKDGTLKRSFS